MHEKELGVSPTLVLLADTLLDWHLHIVEEDFVHFVLAAEHDDGLYGDARCLHIDKQEGNAFLLLHVWIGPHQAKDPIGILPQRRPSLLSIDDIVVALAHGA